MSMMKLMKEIRSLVESPPEGIKVHFSDESMHLLHFDLHGPVDTPFEGGLFKVKLQLSPDHPHSAPKGWFLTKIFHPNMNLQTGEICLSTLKKDWSPSTGLRHCLLAIRCLLIEPNPESALNEDAAKLLLDNYADYYARAKIMTKIHAKAGAAASGEAEAAAASSSAVVAPAAAGESAAAASSAAAGEEENSRPTQSASATAATAAAAKKPLSLSSAANSTSAPAAAAKSAATSAAEAKAKALKKKSQKRL